MGCRQEDCSMNVTSKQRPKGCIQINQVNKWYKTGHCLGERRIVPGRRVSL